MTEALRKDLIDAIRSGENEVVMEILQSSPKQSTAIDVEGKTASHHAAEVGNETVARALKSRNKVNMDTQDVKGQTPLLLAVQSGRESMVKFLLSCGADPSKQSTIIGDSPISIARELKPPYLAEMESRMPERMARESLSMLSACIGILVFISVGLMIGLGLVIHYQMISPMKIHNEAVKDFNNTARGLCTSSWGTVGQIGCTKASKLGSMWIESCELLAFADVTARFEDVDACHGIRNLSKLVFERVIQDDQNSVDANVRRHILETGEYFSGSVFKNGSEFECFCLKRNQSLRYDQMPWPDKPSISLSGFIVILVHLIGVLIVHAIVIWVFVSAKKELSKTTTTTTTGGMEVDEKKKEEVSV